MKKTIEIKTEAFLKKVKVYAAKKKERPTKLPMPPDSISAIKIKFIFAKVEEVTLVPQHLSFFKERLGMKAKAKVTDSDPSKTYSFTFCEALLGELAQANIYIGQSGEEKLEALSAYVAGIKSSKIIIEVIPKASLSSSSSSIGIGERRSSVFTEESGSLVDSPSLDTLTEPTQTFSEPDRKKVEELVSLMEGLEAKIGVYAKLLEKSALKDRENTFEIAQLKEALEQTQLENSRLRGLEEEVMRLRALEDKGKEAEDSQEKDEEAESDDNDVPKNDEIDNLVDAVLAEEETSRLTSEALTQWVNRLLASRNDLVTAKFYDKQGIHEEEQTLPRFLAIAKLGREKAAHFANHGHPWPKEELLAKLKAEGYDSDLGCLFLYQRESFPKELRMFAVLFAFWEAAHHNRFYRNALAAALNSGTIPANLGMPPNASHADAMLKILHYADLTRILMGHYGAIAQSQFNINLYISQEETIARFEGAPADIRRMTTEEVLFI